MSRPCNKASEVRRTTISTASYPSGRLYQSGETEATLSKKAYDSMLGVCPNGI